MSEHPTNFQGNVHEAIKAAIHARVPDAAVEVAGGGGHYEIVVTSSAFAGKSTIESHRLVHASLAHLMKGDGAPLHAIDSLKTRAG